MAKALGIGGLFFKCRDPEALAEWYRQWLDFPANPGTAGSSFYPHTMPPGAYTVFGPFTADTDYFQPSKKEFMLNIIVDDLEGVLRRAGEGGAEIVGGVESYEYGRFGWFIDIEGNKVELWEPAQAP